MATVNHLLRQKGREVYTISPDDSVFDAIRQMACPYQKLYPNILMVQPAKPFD